MKKCFLLIFLFLFYIPIVDALEFSITSQHVILYNLNDDKVLYELDSDNKDNIASLTKIMTVLVAIENQKDLSKNVTITREALEGIEDYTVVGYSVGNVTTIEELLYGAMLPSGADAVNALAIDTAGSVSKFVEMMNVKASELKLKNTHFDNPVGMDSADNYSTARDISLLLKYALQNETFYKVFTARTYTIASLNKVVSSTLIGYSRSYGLDITDIVGAKSGFTDGAGLCLASIATIDDVRYLLVTMKADTTSRSNAVKDSLTIYDYYSSNYGYQTVVKKGKKVRSIPVKWGKTSTYDIISPNDISLYLANDIRKNRIQYQYNGIMELNYKIKKGDKLGSVSVIYEGDTLTTYDVYLTKDISYYHPVLYGVIVICVVVMIISLDVIISRKKRKKKRLKKR